MKTFVLIYLVILCTANCFSQFGFEVQDQSRRTGNQFVEYTHASSQEFRESIKISLAEETESGVNLTQAVSTKSLIGVIPYLRYHCYLREHLFKSPSKKLFIDFGSLII